MILESKLRFDPGLAVQGRVVRTNRPIAETVALERIAAALTPSSRSRAELRLPLSAGAVVDEAQITITAAPAGWQAIGNSAETRAAAGTADSPATSLIIDFQSLRTVSGLKPPPTAALSRIQAWLGTAFVESPIWQAEETEDGEDPPLGVRATFEEAQTERLLVTFSFAIDPRPLAELGEVHLPSPPGDLDLSVGGRQVWSFRGPVRRDAEGWDRYSTTVDIAGALQQSLAEGSPPVSVVLDARTPGVLSLGSRVEIFEVHTVSFAEGLTRAVETDQEGPTSVPLTLPEDAVRWAMHELRFELSGEPTATRVLPPTGPAADAESELLLSPQRSAAVFIPAGGDSLLDQLASLGAVRLFLQAEEESELHGELHYDAGGRPGDPVDGGAFDPLVLSASDSPDWQSLSLPRPLAASQKDLWLVLHISRGRVASPLALGESDLGSREDLLIGLPTGPFRPLPTILALAPAGFRAPLRLVGEAPEQAPIPALEIRAEPPGQAGSRAREAVRLPSMITAEETELRLVLDPPWTGAQQLSLNFMAFAAVEFQIANARVIYRRLENPS